MGRLLTVGSCARTVLEILIGGQGCDGGFPKSTHWEKPWMIPASPPSSSLVCGSRA